MSVLLPISSLGYVDTCVRVVLQLLQLRRSQARSEPVKFAGVPIVGIGIDSIDGIIYGGSMRAILHLDNVFVIDELSTTGSDYGSGRRALGWGRRCEGQGQKGKESGGTHFNCWKIEAGYDGCEAGECWVLLIKVEALESETETGGG